MRNYTCPPMFSACLHAIAPGVSGSESVYVSVSLSASASVVALVSLTICLFSHFAVCLFVFPFLGGGFLFSFFGLELVCVGCQIYVLPNGICLV